MDNSSMEATEAEGHKPSEVAPTKCDGSLRSPTLNESRDGEEDEQPESNPADPLLMDDEEEEDENVGDQSLPTEIYSSSEEDSGNEGNNENVTPEKKPRKLSSRPNEFSGVLARDLRNNGQTFVQDTSCKLLKINKCRECATSKKEVLRKAQCRFYAFRKLKYVKSKTGTAIRLQNDGFSDPIVDPKEGDLGIWLPSTDDKSVDLDPRMAKFLVYQLGDQLCELVRQEQDALKYFTDWKLKNSESANSGKVVSANASNIGWRRPVKNVRDMCDVCETTLFNYHCTCLKCGFVVCVPCFKARAARTDDSKDINPKKRLPGRDEFNWRKCSNSIRPHHLEKMFLCQILPRDVLTSVCTMVHELRQTLGIPQYCCEEGRKRVVQTNDLLTKFLKDWNDLANQTNFQPTLPIASEPPRKGLHRRRKRDDSSDDEDIGEEIVDLKNILKRPRTKDQLPLPFIQSRKQPNVVDSRLEDTNGPLLQKESGGESTEFGSQHWQKTKLLPILVKTLEETSKAYPKVPHSWLCNGKLLRLNDPNCEGNFGLFQNVWKRGQPVLVSNLSKALNPKLWTPESFSEDFGERKNDLVNCATDKIVCNQKMKVFWDGFQCSSKRLRDDKGNPMLLKLKDWPPGDDLKVILPSRFKDLMAALPLKEYTQRDGRLNLAARLPIQFVRPDLGPKMYIAYGSGIHLEKGTTNLHLDISDAVNVMVHVVIPDEDIEAHMAAVREAVLESDCDSFMAERINRDGEVPGAIWHIYNARDADKIRDLINKVFLEGGRPPLPNHDPIHDQCCYLDKELRRRLKAEYNVIGYPIIQCMGDAVFIPAGAPHQVRNLQNCIKIAEDFVSPENVSHCFRLTDEFRNLSETHTNHEDKLQIKNIMYHAVKDAVTVVKSEFNKGQKEMSADKNGN